MLKEIQPYVSQYSWIWGSRVKGYDNNLGSVMVIAHNPGLTNFVNTLTDLNLWNLPTTGLVIINFNVDCWEDIKKSAAEVFCKKFPKELK